MTTICSFCNTIIKPELVPAEPVSHGVCRSCYDRILAENGFNTRKFLDMLSAPVFLVDADVNILEANALALATVQKPFVLVRGKICGTVLDCINSYLPEGCGKTAFCPDCVIRNSVNLTYTTGKPVTSALAVICRNGNSPGKEIHLIVSTRKDGNVVLLRLQPTDAS
jgi:hypothetical protein